MKNEKEIEEIAKLEVKISNQKWYLWASFFLASAVVIWIYVSSIKAAVNSQLGDIQADQMSAIKIIITLSIFAALLVAGFFYNRLLSKKLDKLWEQKKSLL